MSSRVYVLNLLLLTASAHAETFMASFEQAQWRVQRSPLVCRLTQVVPSFGEATFETASGGRESFVLSAKKNPLVGGPSQLKAVAPSWNPERPTLELGAVEIGAGSQLLQLGKEPTEKLLGSLCAGLVPTIARPLQENTNVIASIGLSPVDFQPAYRRYKECVGQLLPVTFDDIKNTVIEFAPSSSELTAAAQKKIDFLLRYIAVDSSISHFEISGASSDHKRRLENLELSKLRSEQVRDYLRSRGIGEKSIATSYRGERGPSGAQRFVSIRLKRSATGKIAASETTAVNKTTAASETTTN